MSLLEMSAKGAVLIGFALLLRKVVGQRLAPGCYLALWALAAVRLLVPFEAASPFSVYQLFSQPSEHIRNIVISASTGNDALVQVDAPLLSTGTAEGFPWVSALWLTGAVICFVGMVSSHWQCRRWYAASLPAEDSFVTCWKEAHPLRRNYEIRFSQLVQTPLTYGLFRPVILLPATQTINKAEWNLVLLHEWNHIRHLDILWQWVLVVLCSVHWFNPAVWLMHRFCRQDLELFCDGAVVRQLAPGQNRGYAMLLLRQAAYVKRPTPVFSPSRFTGYQRMEERIQMIMKPKQAGWKMATAAVLLLCAGGMIFATSASADANGADALQSQSAASDMVWPVASQEADVTLEYGIREHPATGEIYTSNHICIGGTEAKGSPVLAAWDGVVKEAGYHPVNGNYVLIAHDNNVETRYWHCEKLLVENGEAVKAGQEIATLGQTGDATGPCLSFAVYEDGETVDPMSRLEAEES